MCLSLEGHSWKGVGEAELSAENGNLLIKSPLILLEAGLGRMIFSLKEVHKLSYCMPLNKAFLSATNSRGYARQIIVKYSQLQLAPSRNICVACKEIKSHRFPLKAGIASKNADFNHQDSTTIICANNQK